MSKRSAARLLVAGLAVTSIWSAGLSAPALAAEPTTAATAASAAVEPTNLASTIDKDKAAAAINVVADAEMLGLNDQAFTLALWREARDGSFVKAAALAAYTSEESNAAYEFITAGIYVSADDDARAEIAAAAAKALRRSVAVTVGLDPADTALIELDDRNFIIEVWERTADGTHVKAAAATAFQGTQDDWTAFLTTGAAAARERDIQDALDRATEEEAARIRAAALVTAKKALLQLLLLPVTQELVDAPNRQYVLHVLNNAKGTEVQLAAQAALNTPDPGLEQALSDFVFTGGAAANKRDEDAAAAKVLAGYKTQVTAIRDAAKLNGFQPNLLAAADRALTEGTLLALQTFLLKGQEEARALDTAWVEKHRCNRVGTVIGTNQSGGTLQALDFNGDCISDLGHQNLDGQLHLWKATGTIESAKLFTGTGKLVGSGWTQANVPDIIIGDFNGDFKADIVRRMGDGELRAWASTGTIDDGKLFAGPHRSVGAGWTQANYPRILTGDFNGDGKTDIIGQHSSGDLRAWRSTGNIADSGLFTGMSKLVGSGWSTTNYPRIFTADFNGDGKTDIIGQHSSGELRAWPSTGDISDSKLFTGAARVVGTGWTQANYPRILTGDFNGDGKTDIIGQHSSGELRAWPSTGVIANSSLFTGAARIVGTGWTTTNHQRIITGDFNGDGKTDIIGQIPNGELRAWQSTGTIANSSLFTGDPHLVGTNWLLSRYPRLF